MTATPPASGKITFGTAYQFLVVTYDGGIGPAHHLRQRLAGGTGQHRLFASTTSPTITWGGFPAAGSNPVQGRYG